MHIGEIKHILTLIFYKGLILFLKQIIKTDGLPFSVKNPHPNKELLEALKEGEDILNGKIKSKKYHSVKELIEDLENDI